MHSFILSIFPDASGGRPKRSRAGVPYANKDGNVPTAHLSRLLDPSSILDVVHTTKGAVPATGSHIPGSNGRGGGGKRKSGGGGGRGGNRGVAPVGVSDDDIAGGDFGGGESSDGSAASTSSSTNSASSASSSTDSASRVPSSPDSRGAPA